MIDAGGAGRAQGGWFMREIKFRAWNPQVKKMGGGVAFTDLVKYDYRKAAPNLSGWIWMQYTGLKDKNGVEIYEGDIVVAHDNVVHADVRRGEVVFQELTSAYTVKDNSGLWVQLSDLAGFEVIGNVYENTDLMEANQ